MKTLIRILAVVLLLPAALSLVRAQNTMPWRSADAAGGGPSAQPSNSIIGSVGQPAVGTAIQGGNTLRSGYLSILAIPAGAPALTAASSLDFGTHNTGSVTTLPLSVTNTGGADLSIASTVLGGTNAADYAIQSGGGAQTLAPGASVNVMLTFVPSAAGARSATLTIVSNDAASPFIVTLTGAGVATAPALRLSATMLDFGSVTSGSNSIRTLNINNDGNAALHIAGQTIGGVDAGMFVITRTAAATIAASASDAIEITFHPVTTGVKYATLTVTSDDPNTPTAVVQLTLSSQVVDFGQIAPGGNKTLPVVLTNTGTATLTIAGQSVTGTGFTLTTPAAASLAPGTNTTVQITFAPTSAGTFNGSFDFLSNDPARPGVTVQLRGTAAVSSGPRLTLGAPLVDFGNVVLLTTVNDTVEVTNTGADVLQISNQQLAGTDASEFAIMQALSGNIAVGAKSTLRVSASPKTAGSKTAYVRIESNDPTSPVTLVLLVANAVTGTDAVAAVPAGIALHQNWPNPVIASGAGSSVFRYDLDRRASIELSVFDRVGRKVAVLASGAREAGVHRAEFTPGAALPAGMYTAVLRVTTDGRSEIRTRGFVVMR